MMANQMRSKPPKDKEMAEAMRRRWRMDLKIAMSDPVMRRILLRIIEEAKPFDDPYTGNAETYYHLGEQRIGRWLWNELFQVCPKDLFEALSQNDFIQQGDDVPAQPPKKERTDG